MIDLSVKITITYGMVPIKWILKNWENRKTLLLFKKNKTKNSFEATPFKATFFVIMVSLWSIDFSFFFYNFLFINLTIMGELYEISRNNFLLQLTTNKALWRIFFLVYRFTGDRISNRQYKILGKNWNSFFCSLELFKNIVQAVNLYTSL